jgi:hypothetical protein
MPEKCCNTESELREMKGNQCCQGVEISVAEHKGGEEYGGAGESGAEFSPNVSKEDQKGKNFFIKSSRFPVKNYQLVYLIFPHHFVSRIV